MRPVDLRIRMNRLAELVSTSDRRRRVLENIDAIAQGALENEKTYLNKHGDSVTIEAPDWTTALKAQQVGAALLGLEPDTGTVAQPAQSPGMQRILAAVPSKAGGT